MTDVATWRNILWWQPLLGAAMASLAGLSLPDRPVQIAALILVAAVTCVVMTINARRPVPRSPQADPTRSVWPQAIVGTICLFVLIAVAGHEHVRFAPVQTLLVLLVAGLCLWEGLTRRDRVGLATGVVTGLLAVLVMCAPASWRDAAESMLLGLCLTLTALLVPTRPRPHP